MIMIKVNKEKLKNHSQNSGKQENKIPIITLLNTTHFYLTLKPCLWPVA